jgi:hypothetical protein
MNDVINALLYLGENIEGICRTAISRSNNMDKPQCDILAIDLTVSERQQSTTERVSAKEMESGTDLKLNLNLTKTSFPRDLPVGFGVCQTVGEENSPESTSASSKKIRDHLPTQQLPRSRLNSGLILLAPSESPLLQKQIAEIEEFLNFRKSISSSQNGSFGKVFSSQLDKDPPDSLFLIEQPTQRRQHIISFHSVTNQGFKLSSPLSSGQKRTLIG